MTTERRQVSLELRKALAHGEENSVPASAEIRLTQRHRKPTERSKQLHKVKTLLEARSGTASHHGQGSRSRPARQKAPCSNRNFSVKNVLFAIA